MWMPYGRPEPTQGSCVLEGPMSESQCCKASQFQLICNVGHSVHVTTRKTRNAVCCIYLILRHGECGSDVDPSPNVLLCVCFTATID